MSKPEWNEDTPKWANWLAQDRSGSWYWHEEKPMDSRIGCRWVKGGAYQYHSHASINLDWRETLERRP